MFCPRYSARSLITLSAWIAAAVFAGCSGTDAANGNGGKAGAPSGGSSVGTGGGAGQNNTGGAGASTSTAGASGATGTSGAPSNGGSPAVGGSTSVGGALGSSGNNSGGSAPLGGSSAVGGASAGSSSGGSAGAGSTCPAVPPLSGGKQYCMNSSGNAAGKYTYEIWAEGNGSSCMNVFGQDANFSAKWTNVEDFLARVGLTFDRSKTPAQIGTLSADFAETKTADTGLVYVGIYGWTVDPLREYYILDDWGSTKPAGVASDGSPRDSVGTITVDGAVYDVWKKTRTNKPAITGDNMTFDQYFSIRQSARQCGHISISEHFSKWVGLGLQMGKLVESKLLLEAQNSTGSIDFTTATVTVK